MGPDPKDCKSIRILNRCLEWRPEPLCYEADPRHAEMLVKALGLEDCKGAATPGVKEEVNYDAELNEDMSPYDEPNMTSPPMKRVKAEKCCMESQDEVGSFNLSARHR